MINGFLFLIRAHSIQRNIISRCIGLYECSDKRYLIYKGLLKNSGVCCLDTYYSQASPARTSKSQSWMELGSGFADCTTGSIFIHLRAGLFNERMLSRHERRPYFLCNWDLRVKNSTHRQHEGCVVSFTPPFARATLQRRASCVKSKKIKSAAHSELEIFQCGSCVQYSQTGGWKLAFPPG